MRGALWCGSAVPKEVVQVTYSFTQAPTGLVVVRKGAPASVLVVVGSREGKREQQDEGKREHESKFVDSTYL